MQSIDAGVVSNNLQCQITRIRAIARARSRKVSYAVFISSVRIKVRVRVRFNNSHLSRKSRTSSYFTMQHICHDTSYRWLCLGIAWLVSQSISQSVRVR